MFAQFVIPALSLFESIVHPAFQDLVPDGPYTGMLHEFTVMDDVPYRRPIVDLRKIKNILQRRDASCDLIYKKIMNVDTRIITTDDLYAATQMCKHEFYQGALKDWRNDDPLFGNKILPFFKDAVKTDIASNSYFGDVSRTISPSSQWSTDKYDGIFKWLRQYYQAGVIPAGQGITMPVTDMRANPATAYGIIVALYDKQNDLMRAMPNSEKAFYVDQAILDGYQKYIRTLGNTSDVILRMYADGTKIYSYEGVAIYPIVIWEPILTELYGANNHAAILTLDGNWIFGTDKKYGEGENLDEALMIWYERKDLAWYYQMFMKAGTQIALPEHVVFAVPSGLNTVIS